MDETLEEPLLDFGGNTLTVVGDGPFVHAAERSTGETDFRTTILASVRDQVAQDLALPHPVDRYQRFLGCGFDLAAGANHRGDDFLQLGSSRDVLDDILEGIGVELGSGQKILDHAMQILGFVGNRRGEFANAFGRLGVILDHLSHPVHNGERGA